LARTRDAATDRGPDEHDETDHEPEAKLERLRTRKAPSHSFEGHAGSGSRHRGPSDDRAQAAREPPDRPSCTDLGGPEARKSLGACGQHREPGQGGSPEAERGAARRWRKGSTVWKPQELTGKTGDSKTLRISIWAGRVRQRAWRQAALDEARRPR